MSYNGSGTFNINSTGQPVVAGTVITASAFNALTTDLATGLTTAITKDGQTTTTARITFAQGITSSLVTDSSSVSTGSIITAGGAGIAKNLYVGVNANVAGTLGVTGVATFSAAPIYSSLTASSAVATDASKGLVSVTNTGTGNNVLGTSPTIATPTITGDASISGLTVGKGGGAVSTNTAVGASALAATATGTENTGIGSSALTALTTGSYNTAVGRIAMQSNTTGAQNTAMGYATLKACTTAQNNAAFGDQALQASTTASYNTAVGSLACFNTTTGANNVAVGYASLNQNTTASSNTAVGYQAGYSFASTGTAPVTAFGYQAAYSINAADPRITAIGYQALYTNNGGGFYENTAVGYSAAKLTTTGSSLVAVGNECLAANTTGSKNVAIGYQALVANTATSNCTAIGYQAGSGLSGSAGGFTSIGYQSGNNFTNGFNSTFVGNGAQAGAPTGNNEIVICTSGQTGKGTSTGFIAPSTGGVYQGNNSSSWSTTSDQRLKKNIVDNTEGLDKIVQIRVRNFEYRTAEEVTELPAHSVIDKQGVQLGVIAQELREVCPDCVKEESTGVISVDSDNIFWHMINAIKDLKALVDAQATEITALKAKVGI